MTDDPLESDMLKDVQAALDIIAKSEQKTTEVLLFYRRECESEMSLISVRVGWLLTSQAFLVAASILGLSSAVSNITGVGKLLPVVSLVTCVLGIIIRHKSLGLLTAAENTTTLWKERMRKLYASAQAANPSLAAIYLARWKHGGQDVAHDESMKFSRYLPWTFVVFWIILGLISLLVIASLQGWLPLEQIPR